MKQGFRHCKRCFALQTDQDIKKRNNEIVFFYFKKDIASNRKSECCCDVHFTVSLVAKEERCVQFSLCRIL